ncbi:MAG: ATP-dependent zinc metalloprotease FtsH [Actinomycetota bacterium]
MTKKPDLKGQSKQAAEEGKAKSAKSKRSGPALLGASLVALALIYAAALTYLQPASPGKELALDRLVQLANCASPVSADAGQASLREAQCADVTQKISKVRFLNEDSRVLGTLVPSSNPKAKGSEFWTSYVASDAITSDLFKTILSAGAEIRVDPQPLKAIVRFLAQFLLPLVILANLFALFFYLSRGSGSSGASEFLTFGKIGDKRLKGESKGRNSFKDVAAAGEAIIELAEVRDYLANPKAFADMGALPPKGVLLVGPPGCGKTLLARAVAGEAQANFYSISGSEFVESLVGVGAARVRDLFRQARASAPSIIFIDELDAAGRQRGAGIGGGHDEREQTLNELLVQMDGFSPTEGVVAIGATNRPDILDPALLRAGRFDRHITVERPDLEGRLEILKLHARGKRLQQADKDLPHIAKNTSGFTGADLANLLNESALLAVRENLKSIGRHHLEEGVERVLSGPKRKAQIITDDEKRRIAYHEAGHAVVAAAMGKAGILEKVSIIARGRGIGHLAVLAEDKQLLTTQDMEAQVTIAMAGIASEEMVMGQPSTGSEQDLERATNTARDMAGRYGMSSRLGRVRVLREDKEVFLGRDYLLTRDVSQPTLEHLDEEVRRILDEEEGVARDILGAHRDVLDGLAEELISHETIQGPDLAKLLTGVRPYLKVAKSAMAAGNGGTATRSPRRATKA